MKNERFWGLHFDFHAGNEDEIGTRTTVEGIERFILEAKPDFIQCDCKGHPGNSCYPTKVGKAADKLVKDNLRVWSDATKKNGIPLYVHYSGVFEGEYCKKYPERAAVYDAGGEYKVMDKISLFDDRYVDEYMIPQLKELITDYGIAGVWVDGDCWAVDPDYSESAKPYLYDGITKEEHKKLMHDAFLRYVKKYTDELHAFAPDFNVISNWAYTSYIPEPITIDLDYLSGDFQPANSVHEARYEARCMSLREKPWDLMAWGFSLTGWTEKTSVQVMQEATMALTQGGGFQVYVSQNKDGSVASNCVTTCRDVGAFVRDRRFLYGKKPLAQTALLYSTVSYYKDSNIFNAAGATRPLIGTLNALLDAQFTANILYEYQAEQFKDYEVVVVPEWKYIPDSVKSALLDYAKSGGYLMVIGVDSCKQFAQKIGTVFGEDKSYSKLWIMHEKGNMASVMKSGESETKVVDLQDGKLGLYNEHDSRDKVLPAYRVEKLGEGAIAYIPFDFGSLYFERRSFVFYDFIKTVLAEKIEPLIKINRKTVDITMQESENGLLVNLINMQQGRHDLAYVVYDEIPEIYDLEVRIRGVYTKVSMPLGEKFTYSVQDNETVIKLEKLEIHSVIVLEK